MPIFKRFTISVTVAISIIASPAFALNRDYFVGAYVRPLPLLYDEISGATGIGAGMEIRTWKNLYLTSAFDQVETGMTEPSPISIAELRTHFGANFYSERRTDSAFLSLGWTQERLRASAVGRTRKTIGEWNSAGLSAGFGYRWIWQEGLLIKAGLNIGQRSASRADFADESSSLSLQEQKDYSKNLQRINAVEHARIKAALELAVGWSF